MLGTVAAFNPSSFSKVLVRATNWLGDAVMSLPAIRAIRQVFPHAHVAVVARPWVADLYARETSIDRVIPYTAQKGLGAKRAFARMLGRERFDAAILLQNAFDAALMAWLAGIPERIGYNRDARGLLLTRAIPVPDPGDIPRHERFYYLELLRRAGMIERFPDSDAIRLDGIPQAREAGAGASRPAGHRRTGGRHQPRRRLRQRQALAPGALRSRGADTGASRGAAIRLRGRAGAVRNCGGIVAARRRQRP